MNFADCVAAIDNEYAALGHQRGWRFLTCSRERFCRDSKVLLLSLHPGGQTEQEDHPRASCETGSAYRVESWHGYPAGRAPLQEQVTLLATALGVELDSMLSDYFVPFRSPDTASMHRAAESIDFATRLWEGAMDSLSPDLVICLGKETERRFRDVLGSPLSEQSFGVNWDPQTVVVARYKERVVLTLPHLSRFKIMGRPKSLEPLQQVFAAVGDARTEVSSALR